MSRRKKTSIIAPSNASEATLMIGEFTAIERERLLERLAAEEAIDRIKLQRDEKLGDVVSWLSGLRWARAKDFLRTKIELDKQAVIKAVQFVDFASLFEEPQAVVAGTVTVSVELQRTTGTGTINTMNNSLDVTIIAN